MNIEVNENKNQCPRGYATEMTLLFTIILSHRCYHNFRIVYKLSLDKIGYNKQNSVLHPSMNYASYFLAFEINEFKCLNFYNFI